MSQRPGSMYFPLAFTIWILCSCATNPTFATPLMRPCLITTVRPRETVPSRIFTTLTLVKMSVGTVLFGGDPAHRNVDRHKPAIRSAFMMQSSGPVWKGYVWAAAASNKLRNVNFFSAAKKDASKEFRASSRRCSSVKPNDC
jgi:hypothetical protein